MLNDYKYISFAIRHESPTESAHPVHETLFVGSPLTRRTRVVSKGNSSTASAGPWLLYLSTSTPASVFTHQEITSIYKYRPGLSGGGHAMVFFYGVFFGCVRAARATRNALLLSAVPPGSREGQRDGLHHYSSLSPFSSSSDYYPFKPPLWIVPTFFASPIGLSCHIFSSRCHASYLLPYHVPHLSDTTIDVYLALSLQTVLCVLYMFPSHFITSRPVPAICRPIPDVPPKNKRLIRPTPLPSWQFVPPCTSGLSPVSTQTRAAYRYKTTFGVSLGTIKLYTMPPHHSKPTTSPERNNRCTYFEALKKVQSYDS